MEQAECSSIYINFGSVVVCLFARCSLLKATTAPSHT